MLGQSPRFLETLDAVRRASRFDVPVLLEGESGTGKELAARAIHYDSRRSGSPFVPVNCGALSDSLIENELFGHHPGAFTDARTTAPGLLKAAHRGSLFLDEIDALSPRGQVALLRFLQDQTFRPLGAVKDETVDVRLIAASNRALALLATRGEFRTDLLFRIKLMHIELPPLRDRTGDARLLAQHIVSELSRKYGSEPRRLSTATLDWFDDYTWPGNIRELEHTIHSGFIACDGEEIVIPVPPTGMVVRWRRSEHTDSTRSYSSAKAAALDMFNREFLTRALARCEGNVTVAAAMMQKDRRVLGRLLQRYGLDAHEFRARRDAVGLPRATRKEREAG